VQDLGHNERFWQQASAEQLDTCAPVHLPLDRFKTVNMSLDRAIAPRFGNRRFDGAEVLFQRPNKASNRMNARVLRLLQPRVKPNQLAQTKDAAKAQHQFSHHSEVGALLLERIDDFLLLGSQIGTEFAEQSSRYLR
jgi:hypothetical protein